MSKNAVPKVWTKYPNEGIETSDHVAEKSRKTRIETWDSGLGASQAS